MGSGCGAGAGRCIGSGEVVPVGDTNRPTGETGNERDKAHHVPGYLSKCIVSLYKSVKTAVQGGCITYLGLGVRPSPCHSAISTVIAYDRFHDAYQVMLSLPPRAAQDT